MVSGRSLTRRFRTGRSPEAVDWTLIGVCALIWLVLLGMSVAAVVALVDLGRGFHRPAHSAHTGVLYIIIGVSALIVLAAVPVLLRARRAAPARPVVRPPGFPAHDAGAPPLGSGPRARHAATPPAVGPNDDDVARIWLRGTTELVSVIGTALIAVAVATYLMAVGEDGAAWVCYGIAGFITVLMPLVPWRHLRQLRSMLATRRSP